MTLAFFVIIGYGVMFILGRTYQHPESYQRGKVDGKIARSAHSSAAFTRGWNHASAYWKGHFKHLYADCVRRDKKTGQYVKVSK